MCRAQYNSLSYDIFRSKLPNVKVKGLLVRTKCQVKMWYLKVKNLICSDVV